MDLHAAITFVTTHARTLDRRRLSHLLGDGSAAEVVAALDAYRNPDGGYGWALEPDLRSSTSRPVAAMHALEVLAEVPFLAGHGRSLCDWLAAHSLPDGGMPFALPYLASRAFFDPDAIAADLTRKAVAQQPDGGWLVTFPAFSPAAALEWRGYATVQAITVLRENAVS